MKAGSEEHLELTEQGATAIRIRELQKVHKALRRKNKRIASLKKKIEQLEEENRQLRESKSWTVTEAYISASR